MIQWLALKTFAKKVWAWLKNYWYLPVMVVVGIVAFCFGRRDTEGILKMFETSKESYQKEIEVLKESHEAEIKKRNELVEKHNETLKKIEEEYKIKLDELTSAERREIKKIVDKHKDDPDGLAERVGDVFGIRHVE
tara:strand:- start:9 stop:416 length:408 start_codon:yes stop_codon:yes gene_type:complete